MISKRNLQDTRTHRFSVVQVEVIQVSPKLRAAMAEECQLDDILEMSRDLHLRSESPGRQDAERALFFPGGHSTLHWGDQQGIRGHIHLLSHHLVSL